jgi:hypothetical protein
MKLSAIKNSSWTTVLALMGAFICVLLGLHRFLDRPEAMDAWIDPEIQGHERDVMREVLRSLPISGRDHVSYVDKDNNAYSNRVNERPVIAKPAGNGRYTYDGKEFFALPPH